MGAFFICVQIVNFVILTIHIPEQAYTSNCRKGHDLKEDTMQEYAIILSYENGETSVSYFTGTREGAMKQAGRDKRIAAAEAATVAMVCGFIGIED